MLVTSAKKQRYRGARIGVGDTFDVARKDARLLRALGWIKEAVPQQDEVQVSPTPNPVAAPVVTTNEIAPVEVDQTHEENAPTHEEVAPVTHSTSPSYETSDFSRLLRERAEGLGIKVDGRWSDARVQREIDLHNQNIYQRRDMRAEGTE